MRRALALGLLAVLLCAGGTASAQGVIDPTPICAATSSSVKPMVGGYQQLTVSTSAVALTVPAGALYAVAILEITNGIRYRDDGTNPTATVGMPIAGGGWFPICALQLAPMRLIRSGAADAVVNISYYGR